jgi:hypothetical protein
MKWMTEGSNNTRVSSWRKYAGDFGHDGAGVANMLQDSVALDASEQVRSERERVRVGDYVDSGDGKKVYVDVSGRGAATAANVEIPAAEREILGLAWIVNERRRRSQPALETVREPLGVSGPNDATNVPLATAVK